MASFALANVLTWASWFGQAPPDLSQNILESVGTAVIDGAPSYVAFSLCGKAEGTTFAESVQKALELEPRLRAELSDRELVPTGLVFSDVSIPDIQTKAAQISAELRFATKPFAVPEDGDAKFAALCDAVADLASALSCRAEGPILGCDDKQALEDAAVGSAVERAYPAARAAAQIMNAQITSVQRVFVESVTWDFAPGPNAPSARRISCRARVKVQYSFSPS